MFKSFRCLGCGRIDWHNLFRRLRPSFYRRVPVPDGESPLAFWMKEEAKHAHCPPKPIDFSSQVLPNKDNDS